MGHGFEQTFPQRYTNEEFPGSPAVRTQIFHCHGPSGQGSIPSGGTKICKLCSMGKIKKKDIQLTNKHMVRSSISLASIEMQMKTTLRYHYLLSRIVTIKKKWKTTSIAEYVEETKLLHIAGRNIK